MPPAPATRHPIPIGPLLLALLLAAAVTPAFASDAGDGDAERASRSGAPPGTLRLISLNPSLTAIVDRLGRADTLVGIDDYSARLQPELAGLPRVGGLFDPSLESVVSLRPDLVLVVAGVDQQSHAERLRRAGLEVEVFRNEKLDEVLENIDRLGRMLGRRDAAAQRIRVIRRTREAVRRATRGRPRPDTVAVLDRAPLFVVGAETFLDEMLSAVGARNLGAALGDGYPRASIEWLIDASPELLLDMTPDEEAPAGFWSRWPSLPAVAAGRVVEVDASRISLPGPDIDGAMRALAVAVHGAAVAPAIDAALEQDAALAKGAARAKAATLEEGATP